MAAVLKITCQGQIHRVILPDGSITFEGVWETIQDLYPGSSMVAKYYDDENDLCILCQASFSDFVSLSGEHNGKKTLRLELTTEEDMCAKIAAGGEGQEETNDLNKPVEKVMQQFAERLSPCSTVNPMAAMMQMGMGMFKAFAKGAFNGCHDDQHGLRKIKFLILRLHQSGVLDSTAAAALGIHFLPKMLCNTLNHTDKIDCMFKKHAHALMPLLQDLHALVQSTPGLEQCEGKIADLLSNASNSASEALLELLSALDIQHLEVQAAFFRTLFIKQAPYLEQRCTETNWCKPSVPNAPFFHHGITCDGCNKSPLQGLRFKCKECADYDLCADCYTKKSCIHSGECKAHEFEIVMPWGKGVGKGLGWCCDKGKGKGKGKACCKGKFGNDREARSKDHPLRPCGRAGCKFAATWHPTHCCGACAHGGHHGPRCERALAPVVGINASSKIEQQTPIKTQLQDPLEIVRDGADETYFDFTFPVVVEDGRQLTISWNKVDDIDQVAMCFANVHGIPLEELPTIKGFLEHATRMCEAAQKKKADEEQKETDLTQAQKQVEEMGFINVEDDTKMCEAAQKKKVDEKQKEADLEQAQKHLEEMGFGDGEILLELLKNNGGSMQRVLEQLTGC